MPNDTIGSLTAVVRATATQFAADMKRVEGLLDELKEHSEGIDFKEAFGIGAAIELVKGGVELAKKALETFLESFAKIGQLKKFSEEIGATTQQVQGLRVVAEHFHVTSETLDTALVKMTKNIGELQTGSKEITETFSRLGIKVEDIAGLSAGEQFTKIGDSIKRLGNASDETYAAMSIFGKGAAELVNVFNAGSEAAMKLQEEARKAGIILSDEDVAAADGAEQSIRELKVQWEALTNHLAVEFAPAIKVVGDELKKLVEYLTQHAHEIGQLAGGVIKSVGGLVGLFVGSKLEDKIDDVMEQIKKATAEQAALDAAAAADKKAHAGEVTRLKLALVELDNQLTRGAISYKDFAAAAAKARAAVGGSGVTADEAMKTAFAEADKIMKHFNEEGARIEKEMRLPLEKLKDTIADLGGLLKVHAIDWETYSRAVKKAGDEATRAMQAHKKLQEVTEAKSSAGLDVRTTAGVTAELTASRFAADLQSQRIDVEKQQLDVLQQSLDVQRAMSDALQGGPGGAGAAVADQVAEF